MTDLAGKTKLLLVDDEEDIRDVLGIFLEDIGYEVATAENGEEALRLFRQHLPPVVLTDIKMPGMDGIELLQEIKKERPDTEVIMVTGHGDTDLAIKSLKYEAIDFITKPVNDDVLEVALKRAHEKISTREKLREYTKTLETVVQEKAELQDHLSSLGLMLGSVSHGIKNLLTKLDAGLYDVKSGIEKRDSERITAGYGIVKAMVGRIRKMVLDILFYAKDRELEKTIVSVAAFAEDIAASVQPRADQQRIELMCDIDQEAGEFEADTEALGSALINILENAVDACVQDHAQASHQIVFKAWIDGPDVVFDIRDDGIGMDSETSKNIFNLFFSAKGKKGTGLGLFIAETIISKHNGQILVDSTKGEGSRFTIKIPGTSLSRD